MAKRTAIAANAKSDSLRSKLIKTAPVNKKASWFKNLELSDPKAAKEVGDLVDEWIAGGEIVKHYPSQTSIARGISKNFGISIHTILRLINDR